MNKSVQLSVKSDLMSILEYYKQTKMSFHEWQSDQYYIDCDKYENDDEYKNSVNLQYKEYTEKIDYNNDLIEKLSDFLYKI